MPSNADVKRSFWFGGSHAQKTKAKISHPSKILAICRRMCYYGLVFKIKGEINRNRGFMRSKKKFDTSLKPRKPSRFWHFLECFVSPFYLMPVGGKIKKINCKGLKPPYLVLSTHASMVDFPMSLMATFPYRMSWVASIEEFVGREFLFRKLGVIYKRKFTSDITVVRHVLHALKKNRNIITIYPEARFSIAGVNERLDNALGKLAKTAKVPVVVFKLYGNFIRSPQWNKHPYRKTPVRGEFIQVATLDEVITLPAEEIQRRIEENFVYDDYKWQYDNKIKITCKERATNLHKILYRCPHCQAEFKTYAKGTKIWCENCGKVWEMDYYGRLHCENGEDIFNHIPDWYRWERQTVREEIESGNYRFEDEARLELLACSHYGFKPLGNVKLTHDYRGFTMKGTIDGKPFNFNRDPATMYSCHIEYDFKQRGDAIDLCTNDDTYFVFPQSAVNCLTKLHFATEEMHDYILKQRALADHH